MMRLVFNLKPSMMKRYFYLQHTDTETDCEVYDPSTHKYLWIAQGQSSPFYTSKATLPSTTVVQNDVEFENITKAEKNRATHEMLTINGTSQTSKVKIGGEIFVKLPKSLGVPQHVDTFLVTSVTHEYDLAGRYRNSFTGISATVENVPMEPVHAPVAGPQLAWVEENVDAEKRGRIKVQFQWQKDTGKTTNWIRQQTEDAGFSDVFAKNRGHTFLPEKGDQVIIGFMYGDPNRPYVAGAVFPETKSEGGKEDNNIKSIKTRSGHIIEFNDSEAAKSITITDICGNIITLNTVGGQIKIHAPKKITVTSEDIEISASKSLMLSSGKDTQQYVGTEYNQTVGENHSLAVGKSLNVKIDEHMKLQTSTGNVNVLSGSEILESAKGNVRITSEKKTDIISQSDITIQSGKNVYIAK